MTRYFTNVAEYLALVGFAFLAVWLCGLIGMHLDAFAVVACMALYRAIRGGEQP